MITLRRFVTICLAISLFASCGNDNVRTESSENKPQTKYDNYQEACHAQDFEAAHKMIAAMKNSGDYDYEEAREYVFNQEALFLIAMNDEVSTKRLFFLLQEDANEVSDEVRDNRCSTIIDLAIKQQNLQLVEQTISQYSGKIDDNTMHKIYNFFYIEGKKPDVDNLIALLHKNDCIQILIEDAIEKNDDKLLMNIITKTGLRNSSEAAQLVADYAVKKKNRKMMNTVLSTLRTNNQWDVLLAVGIATSDLTLVKQGYQNTDKKDDAFDMLMSQKQVVTNRPLMQYILTLATNEKRAKTLIDFCLKNDNAEAVISLTKKFSSKFEESFLDEIMNYSISKEGVAFTNLVISILTCTPIEGTPLPAGQRMTSNRPASVVSDHNNYVRSVTSFNRKCDEVLRTAISQHKRQLATKVVTLYKDVPIEYVVNEHWWQIAKTCTYSNEDKKRAQEELNAAKQRGDI